MTEALVVGMVTGVGSAGLILFRGGISRVAVFTMSPIAGIATYVFASLLLTSVGVFAVWRAVLLASIAGVVWVVVAMKRPGSVSDDRRRDVVVIVAAAVAASAGAWLVSKALLTRVSFDSFIYLMAGDALEDGGAVTAIPFSFVEVLKRQLTTPAIEAVGSVSALGYSMSWIPLIGLSAFATTGWFAWIGMDRLGVASRTRVIVMASTMAVVLTTNQVWLHVFYINSHMVVAGLLVAAAGTMWLALVDARWELSLLAGLLLAAVVPTRAEGMFVALIFLLPILTVSHIPSSARWALALPSVAVSFLWYGWAISLAPPDIGGPGASTVVGNLVLAAGLAVFVLVANRDRFRRMLPIVSWVVIVGLVAATGLALARESELGWETLSALVVNTSLHGLWGAFWWIIGSLVIVTGFITTFPGRKVLLFPIGAFMLSLPLLAFVRGTAFRVGWGDSANRMLMHIALVAALYVMLALGALTTGRYDTRSDDPRPGSRPERVDAV